MMSSARSLLLPASNCVRMTQHSRSLRSFTCGISSLQVSTLSKKPFINHRLQAHQGPSFWRPSTSISKSFFSSLVKAISNPRQPIRILFASQGGTAQLFAHQLHEALEEQDESRAVTVQGMHESKTPDQLLTPGDSLHVFLVSVAGVGEPPDNGREFYEWIMTETENEKLKSTDLSKLEYAVFGLGNENAHPLTYNVIGKTLDQRLEDLGASRIMELGLGDDGDCIEDDFDIWMENLCKVLSGEASAAESTTPAASVEEVPVSSKDEDKGAASETSEKLEDTLTVSCPGIALAPCGTRMVSSKYPILNLKPAESDVVRGDLFHLQGTDQQFYRDDTAHFDVVSNKLLTVNAGETGLHELRVSLHDHYNQKNATYEAGDHLIVYPRNSQCIVESYLNVLDVNRHAIIDKNQPDSPSYPHPVGLTIYETLSHCVDLGAVPSPSFARMITGRKQLDYKNEIANPRRTVIDLLHESGKRLSLEDLLYNLTPMRHRYYSIASSPLRHPDEIYLVFRPVKYMSSKGILREGVCTSYMSYKGVVAGDEFASIAAVVNPNPTFRLPEDPETSVLMVAGGCGIAPIRAFLEERIGMDVAKYGPAMLYLGFRNPDDEVYKKIVQEAIDKGAVTDAKVSFSFGCTSPDQKCMLVTELVRSEGAAVWKHIEGGGYTYLCGGARTFGAAIENELLEIIQEYGKMDSDQATSYMRNLIDSGRLCEDLAD